LDFFGLNFSKDGVKLTETKIDSLLNAAEPRDIKELKSLCGLINYASKFITDAATLLSPFHNLLKLNFQFIWIEEHSKGLKSINKAQTTEAMGYFDENWQTELGKSADQTTSSSLDNLNINNKFQDDCELSEGGNQGVDNSISKKS
jgi:hypothetical protein